MSALAKANRNSSRYTLHIPGGWETSFGNPLNKILQIKL